ncbi:hypothetical protein E2320_012757 [Naja naja]|nr:hypothetical protein E2320_012757 [Naja naja]
MVRFRNRYFLCEIISEDPRCRQFIEERIVHNAILWFLSSVKYLNAYTRVVLFCCRKDFYRLLWSSLPFITQLENRSQHCPCSFNTLHVGADREAIWKLVQSCLWEFRDEESEEMD